MWWVGGHLREGVLVGRVLEPRMTSLETVPVVLAPVFVLKGEDWGRVRWRCVTVFSAPVVLSPVCGIWDEHYYNRFMALSSLCCLTQLCVPLPLGPGPLTDKDQLRDRVLFRPGFKLLFVLFHILRG